MRKTRIYHFWVVVLYSAINFLVASQEAHALDPQCKLYTDASLTSVQAHYFADQLGYVLHKVPTSTLANHETLAPLLTDSSFVLSQSETKNKYVLLMSITNGKYNSKGWIPLEVPVQADLHKNSNLNCGAMIEYVAYTRRSRESVVYFLKHSLGLKTNPEMSFGQSLIQLEHHYLISKGEKSPNLQKINGKYMEILRHIKGLHLDTQDVIGLWPKVYKAIYSPENFNIDYCRRDTLLISALDKKCTNCVGFAALFVSLFIDLGLKPPPDWILGVEMFKDHIKPVLYSKKNNRVYDLSSGEFANPVGAIYPTSALSRPAVIGFNLLVTPEEKQYLEKKSTQVFFSPSLCFPSPLDLGFYVRLQLFNWRGYKSCGRYTNENPPETSNLDNVSQFENREKSTSQSSSDETENDVGRGFFHGVVKWFGFGVVGVTDFYVEKMLQLSQGLSANERADVEQFAKDGRGSFFNKYKVTDFFKKIGQESSLVSFKMQDTDFANQIENVYFFPASIYKVPKPQGCNVNMEKGVRIIDLSESWYSQIENAHSLDRYVAMSKKNKSLLKEIRQRITLPLKIELAEAVPFLSSPQILLKLASYIGNYSCYSRYQTEFVERLYFKNFEPLPLDLQNKLKMLLFKQEYFLDVEMQTFSKEVKKLFFVDPLPILSEIDKSSQSPQNLAENVFQMLTIAEEQQITQSILKMKEYLPEKTNRSRIIEWLESVFWHDTYFFTVEPDDAEKIYQNTTVVKIAHLKILPASPILPPVNLPKLPLDWCGDRTSGYVGSGSLYVDCGSSLRRRAQTKISNKTSGSPAHRESSGAGQQDQAGLERGTSVSTDPRVKSLELSGSQSVMRDANYLLQDPRLEVQLKPSTFEYLYYLSPRSSYTTPALKLGLFHSYRNRLEKSFDLFLKNIPFYVNEHSPHSIVVKVSVLLKKLKQMDSCSSPDFSFKKFLRTGVLCRGEYIKQFFENKIQSPWSHVPAIYPQKEFARVALDRLLKNTNPRFSLLEGLVRHDVYDFYPNSAKSDYLLIMQINTSSESLFQMMLGGLSQASHEDRFDFNFLPKAFSEQESKNILDQATF